MVANICHTDPNTCGVIIFLLGDKLKKKVLNLEEGN